MSKFWAVTRREFIERVRNKWFVAMSILGPLFMVALMLIPAWVARESAERKVTISVVDHHGAFAERLKSSQFVLALVDRKQYEFRFDSPETVTSESLLKEVEAGKIDGFLNVPKGVLEGETIKYQGSNSSNVTLGVVLRQVLNRIAQAAKAESLGISEKNIQDVFLSRVSFDVVGEKGTDGAILLIVGYAMALVLYMAILLYGVAVLRSVITEKTHRAVEMVVSTLRPTTLMLGKIAGVGGAGLLQMAIWLVAAVIVFNFRQSLFGAFGIGLPDWAFGGFTARQLIVFLVFFVAGYIFYAALYAGVGAMVSEESDAQQVQAPVLMLLIVPMLCLQFVADDPDGATSEVLTLLPFSSPVLMPMRYLLDGASLGQVFLSLGILLASTLAVVWLAARVYRVGILMYGKRASFREVLHWIRQ